jgi:proline dehydrogenase
MQRLSQSVLRGRPTRLSARYNGARNASTTANPSLSRKAFRWTLVGTGIGTASAVGVALYRESQLEAAAEANGTRPPTPLRELVRTYVVYSMCSIPKLVDWSPTILSTMMSIPVVNKVTEAVVRVTFFDQVRPSRFLHI